MWLIYIWLWLLWCLTWPLQELRIHRIWYASGSQWRSCFHEPVQPRWPVPACRKGEFSPYYIRTVVIGIKSVSTRQRWAATEKSVFRSQLIDHVLLWCLGAIWSSLTYSPTVTWLGMHSLLQLPPSERSANNNSNGNNKNNSKSTVGSRDADVVVAAHMDWVRVNWCPWMLFEHLRYNGMSVLLLLFAYLYLEIFLLPKSTRQQLFYTCTTWSSQPFLFGRCDLPTPRCCLLQEHELNSHDGHSQSQLHTPGTHYRLTLDLVTLYTPL